MALSADDRLLGEKTHYYCSSSEDEGEEDKEEGRSDDVRGKTSNSSRPQFIPDEQVQSSEKGAAVNTGPKGVIEDWRRYKQLETEKREDQEAQRIALAKKLAITCRTSAEDDKAKSKDAAFLQQIEDEFDELEEEFIKEYRQKRFEELRNKLETTPKFNKVYELSREQFLDAVDKEHQCVPVIIHIYEKGVAACDTMNRCLDSLAVEHQSSKFCRIRVSEVKMSINFAISGVPALLIYRNGGLIGNFVCLGDEFGDEFFPTDVESFLIEHGMLSEESTRRLNIIRSSARQSDSDSD